MKLFAVKDMKAGIYLNPNFQRSVADAIRSWEVVANEGESMVSKFPHDFRLYHLADFSQDNGILSVLETPQDLGSAADFKKRPAQQLPLDLNAQQ